ncbi:IS5 family transposase [Jonesiaceae bacterium BS-20]|uniref:IS5 family transposase n=1 Tax=Jonesiaceae bacterium BS-20 TaxID=3120821 RepID=A0AAU7E1D2_9MICO
MWWNNQDFFQFTDEQWERVEPLLPSNEGRKGRSFADGGRVVEGIIYRYRTGIPWRDLPSEFGPWQTVWKRHRRYAVDGTWDRVFAQILGETDGDGGFDWNVSIDATINRAHQHGTNIPRPDQDAGALSNYKNLPICEVEPAGHGIGRSRGGLSTKMHFAVNGNGRPLSIVVTGGQRHDGAMLQEVLGDIRVPRLGPGAPRTRPSMVLADRGYTSKGNRAYLRLRGIGAVIREKSNEIATRKRKGRAGGRPPEFDRATYRNRNVVERAFGLLKQWRGIATRYDTLAVTYRAGVDIAAILTWVCI